MNEEEFQTPFGQLVEQVQVLNARVLELEQMARKNQELASLALDAALTTILPMHSGKDTLTHSFQTGDDWARRRMTHSNIVEIASSLIDGYLWRIDRVLASAASDPHETMNKIFLDKCDDPRFCWEQVTRWARAALEQYTDDKTEILVEDGELPIPTEVLLMQQKIAEYTPKLEQWEQTWQHWLKERAEAKRRSSQRMALVLACRHSD